MGWLTMMPGASSFSLRTKCTMLGPATLLEPAPSSRSRSMPSQPYCSGHLATFSAISSAAALEVSQCQGPLEQTHTKGKRDQVVVAARARADLGRNKNK